MTRASFLLVLASLPFGAAALASTDPAVVPQVIVQEGDSVLGVGVVTGVYNLSVNNSGDNYVEVDTDNADTTVDYAIVWNGPNLLWQEGQGLPAPFGANIDTFDSMSLANNGHSAYVWDLGNTVGGSDDDYAVFYFDNAVATKLLQEGEPVGFAGPTAGTAWTYFAETKTNDNGELLVIGYCDDVNIAGSSEFTVLKLDVATGTQTKIAFEADPAPGTAETFFSFSSDPASSDINEAGDILYQANLTGPSTMDRAIYLNQTLLLREGDASPVPGRPWSNLSGANIALSNDGDWACLGHIDGDNATKRLLVVNGEKVMQEGDSHPAFAPATINYMASDVWISDDGDVIYAPQWNGSQSSGLFYNNKCLIQSGVTQINGQTVEAVYGSTDTMSMSDDGRYIMAEVRFPGFVDAAVMIDRGPWEIQGGALGGASGEPRLRAWGPLTGGSFVTVDLDHAPPLGTANLIVGLSEIAAPFWCTTVFPHPDIVIPGLLIDARGELSFSAPLPAVMPAGLNLSLQYIIDDPTVACGGYASSNAVKGTTP